MENSLEHFLQSIQPGLTLYGVLLTFAVIAFAISRHFWRYEKELIAENIDRLKDLLDGFRQQYIEPIISGQLDNATSGAYEAALLGLMDDLYPKKQGEGGVVIRELLPEESIKELLSEPALRDRLSLFSRNSRSGEGFLASASGKALMDKLDELYEQKKALAQHYSKAQRSCARTCYGSLAFSLLTFVGILHLIVKWPRPIIYMWLLLAIQAAAYTIYSFSRLERHRRLLFRMWEKLRLHGTV